MKKALAPAAKPKHKGKPQGVVDIVPRPFSFCKGSGSPCPITPPELETLPPPVPVVITQEPAGRGDPLSRRIARFLYTTPLAGPWGVSLGLRRAGGYRGNEIFFMCSVLCASGSPYSANESFFYVGIFRRFGRGKGPFPAGCVLSLLCGKRGLPRASTGLCARVCVSFPECPGTPRVRRFQIGPLFSDGGQSETVVPLFSPQNRRCFAGSQSHFPFSHGKDPRQTIRLNYCLPNSPSTAYTPPAVPPRFPARNTRKTTPCRDRPHPPGSPLPAGAQRADPAAAPGPFAPPGARLPG